MTFPASPIAGSTYDPAAGKLTCHYHASGGAGAQVVTTLPAPQCSWDPRGYTVACSSGASVTFPTTQGPTFGQQTDGWYANDSVAW